MPLDIKNLPHDGYSERENSDAINQVVQFSLSFGGNLRPAGNQYFKNEIIYDPPWTMVANKDTTDRPAPQATGLPFFASQLGTAPPWTIVNEASAAFIVTGQRYHFTTAINILGWRFWVTDPSPQKYTVILIIDPLGATPLIDIVLQDFEVASPGDDEWFPVNIGTRLVPVGAVFDLILLAESTAIPIQDSGVWVYKQSNGNPSEGEINHQNGGAEMRVHKTDKDSVAHNAFLEAMSEGDHISGGGIEWIITSVSDNGTHMRYGVSPTTRAQEDDLTMTFSQEVAASINYVTLVDHFLGSASVEGFKGVDTITGRVLDESAYGVDIELQTMTFSPDWAVMAYTGL